MNAHDQRFPPGGDEARVRDLIAYFEAQTDEEAVAEHEGLEAFDDAKTGIVDDSE